MSTLSVLPRLETFKMLCKTLQIERVLHITNPTDSKLSACMQLLPALPRDFDLTKILFPQRSIQVRFENFGALVANLLLEILSCCIKTHSLFKAIFNYIDEKVSQENTTKKILLKVGSVIFLFALTAFCCSTMSRYIRSITPLSRSFGSFPCLIRASG